MCLCSQNLMDIAARALRTNITTLGPRVLPLMEKLRFALNWCNRKVCWTFGNRCLKDWPKCNQAVLRIGFIAAQQSITQFA